MPADKMHRGDHGIECMLFHKLSYSLHTDRLYPNLHALVGFPVRDRIFSDFRFPIVDFLHEK
jgi:hypothetical protein